MAKVALEQQRHWAAPRNFLVDEVLKMLYPPTESAPLVIYGKLGKGKSCFAIKTAVSILYMYYHWDLALCWEKVKELIVFHPTQFFDKIKTIRASGYRAPCLIWDDAGLWLNSMRYNDPFIKAAGEYMNVMRSSIGGLFLTTPDPDYIYKKIREMPESIKVQIDYPRDQQNMYGIWGRDAKYYINKPHVYYGRRTYRIKRPVGPDEWRAVQDLFSCQYPAPFFDWYKPLRDTYEEMALDRMRKEWERLEETDQAKMIREYPGLQLPAYDLHGTTTKEHFGFSPLEGIDPENLTRHERQALRKHYPDLWERIREQGQAT